MAKNIKKKNRFFIYGKPDYVILVVVGLLLSIGLIMLLSASAPKALSESGNSYKYIKNQIRNVILGLIIAVALSRVDFKIYQKLRPFIYFFTILVLILVGLTGIDDGGARRWISIFGHTFQPSEFAKVSLIVYFAAFFSAHIEKGKLKDFGEVALKTILVLGSVAVVLIFLQNHFSTVVIMGLVTSIQLFIAGLSWIVTLLGAGIMVAIGALGIFLAKTGKLGFRGTRIVTWLNIEGSGAIKEGYQILQSLCAIGSGGFLGLGLGNGRQKYSYLPEAQNDFIFPIVAEELGFLGAIIVIILFLVFVWRGLKIAAEAKDPFSKILATGCTSLIGVQALINMAVVTNTIPVTGVPLPFFSYGGSAMIANLAAVGLLIAVSRKNNNKSNDFEDERIEK